MAEELERELQAGNAHRVRELCRANPALLRGDNSGSGEGPSTSSLRLRVWACLLLGRQLDDGEEEEEDNFVPNVPCREYQVLLNDVPRTRAVLFGKNEEAKSAMQYTLHRFCIKQNIEYKQGLNEVVAPFVWLMPPKGKKASKLASDLFEAFTIRFIERFYCTDSSFFLMKSFRLFHLLLTYHDPQLAIYLKEQDFLPELYTPQFFLCLYARDVPLEQVILIWDLFIVFDDPAFTFFIGACLITQQRNKILLTDMHGIPEVISSNDNFKTAEGITTILNEAHALYRRTPRSFIRHLRLCCVGSSLVTPTFNDISRRREESGEDGETHIRLSDFDRKMVLQTTRPAIFMSAHELISILDPLQSNSSGAGAAEAQPDLVLIDLRAAFEGIETGGGLIPRAIQLEPDFLDYPEAFRAWLQHFDGTRGVAICIIDTPPVQSTSNTKLWRRLLLGEGDGAHDPNAPSPRPDSSKGSSANGRDWKGAGGASDSGPQPSALLSLESQEDAIIQAVASLDERRAALRLAKVLQRETFAFVSVLEGGFPALVAQLRKQRGRVEPMIIQHDPDRWDQYTSETGRDVAVGGDLEGDVAAAKARVGYSSGLTSPRGEAVEQRPPRGRVRRPGDLSTEERLALAVKRARELQHATATVELESRLAVLTTQRKAAREREALESMPIIDFR